MECDGDWFACKAGWINKCVDSKKCLIEFLDGDFGEGTYERLLKYIKNGIREPSSSLSQTPLRSEA